MQFAAICFGVTLSCCCGSSRKSSIGYLTPMVIRGELVLTIVAIALALIAIASILSGHLARWRTPIPNKKGRPDMLRAAFFGG